MESHKKKHVPNISKPGISFYPVDSPSFLRFRPSFRKVPTALSKAAAKTLAVSLLVSRAKSWRLSGGLVHPKSKIGEFTTKYDFIGFLVFFNVRLGIQ